MKERRGKLGNGFGRDCNVENIEDRYPPMCLVPSEHNLGYNFSVNASNISIKWENSADTRARSMLAAVSSPYD
ncbi:hypothetical protein Pcinc_005440 [Petrolisthes cinctipes]|uniref:Uncharacterized protein n=1 Tax=Petrolisthes cinctipes TaxID=88211 RepID=A0AAE1GDH4_PETCI|nr:hypothetical protein Pcinc_005440 [Petrolisthes cinctipes]